MWQAAGVFRNAAIVGQMRNRFYVRERRPAQRQPFGLEDAATCPTQSRGWDRDVLQHVGLLIAKMCKMKRGGRFPASPGALFDSAGSTGPGGLRMCVHRLFGRLRHRDYRYESAAVGFCTELDMPFDLGKESMVGAHADIKAGMPGGAALTRDNVAGNHVLAAIGLDAQALARGISSVSR